MMTCHPPSPVRCLVLTPSGAGNQSGSDWNNAAPAFPSLLNPGDSYYMAGGDYSSTAGYVFKNPDPGVMITIKKATQAGSLCCKWVE